LIHGTGNGKQQPLQARGRRQGGRGGDSAYRRS
jgi:hypothetical protein